MVSALLLTGLFFKLGVEQRMREIGTLRALGFSAREIRKVFLIEGAVSGVAGHVGMGAAAAIGYGELILFGLRHDVGLAPWARGCCRCTPNRARAGDGQSGGIVAALGFDCVDAARACGPVTPRGL